MSTKTLKRDWFAILVIVIQIAGTLCAAAWLYGAFHS
jgi:hypothetical protein